MNVDIDKSRAEFEKEWGQTSAEQGLHFIPGLNVYGCDLAINGDMAERKSSAWYYWQKSRAALVVELPKKYMPPENGYDRRHNITVSSCASAIRAAGITVKEDA